MAPGGKKTKDTLEMVGDFFREAAVLVLIFYPLEMSKNPNGTVPLPLLLIVGSSCIALLLMGIALEKLRGQ